MPTTVRAAPAGGHRTDKPQLTGDSQVGVAAQLGEQSTLGHPGLKTAQLDGGARGGATGPRHYPGLELTGDDGVSRRAQRQIPRHPRVEAEEAQGQLGPPRPHGARHPAGQSHGRVHRHRQGDPIGPVHIVG